MARELKTVHIDNEALWVRLVLHQCYINERNINSQARTAGLRWLTESLTRCSPAGRHHGSQPVRRAARAAAG